MKILGKHQLIAFKAHFLKVFPDFGIRDYGELGTTILAVQELEQVTEDLSAVTAVDFLNDEVNLLLVGRKIRITQRLPGTNISVGEHLGDELICQFLSLHNRILVAVYRNHHRLI